jgi:hypothetical protein
MLIVTATPASCKASNRGPHTGIVNIAWASDASMFVKSALARFRGVGTGCGRGSV